MMLIAQRYFRAHLEQGHIEDELIDALLEACGIDKDDIDSWPCDDFSFDYYDESFEFWNVREGWEPTPDQLGACAALGFDRAWFNYAAGYERAANLHERILAKPQQRDRPVQAERNRKIAGMYEEREGWKRTASIRGFELIALLATVERLEQERIALMDALGISFSPEDGTYFVLGKLASYECDTLIEAARLSRKAPEHGWYKHVAQSK